jgi:ribosomal protein RSM22 (predicted rRNA methylase)
MGGVGREVMEKEAIKMEGKSELREVEGGEFEMVSLSKHIHEPKNVVSAESRGSGLDEETMRGEAYRWPRVVAPPMKRAGHVILDTCFPDGESSSIHSHLTPSCFRPPTSSFIFQNPAYRAQF